MVLFEAPSAKSVRTSNSREVSPAAASAGAFARTTTRLASACSPGAARRTPGNASKQAAQSVREPGLFDIDDDHQVGRVLVVQLSGLSPIRSFTSTGSPARFRPTLTILSTLSGPRARSSA